MSKISYASSEIIKSSLFRAREHLQCLPRNASKLAFQQIAWSSYEFNRALGLPSVKHDEGFVGKGHAAEVYLDDALMNFTAVLDYPIHELDLAHMETNLDQIETVSRELMKMCQLIPLPDRAGAQ